MAHMIYGRGRSLFRMLDSASTIAGKWVWVLGGIERANCGIRGVPICEVKVTWPKPFLGF